MILREAEVGATAVMRIPVWIPSSLQAWTNCFSGFMPTFSSPLKAMRIVPKAGVGFGFRGVGGSVRVSIILGEGVAVVVRRERLFDHVRIERRQSEAGVALYPAVLFKFLSEFGHGDVEFIVGHCVALGRVSDAASEGSSESYAVLAHLEGGLVDAP